MTSFDPTMLDDTQVDALVAQGRLSADVGNEIKTRRSAIVNAYPVEEPLAHRAGQVLRESLPSGAEVGNAVINAIPGARPVADAVSFLGKAGHEARELVRGASGTPSLQDEERQKKLAELGGFVEANIQPGAPQSVPSSLAQPTMAYRPGGGGGGGLYGIANEMKRAGDAQQAVYADAAGRLDESGRALIEAGDKQAEIEARRVQAQGDVHREALRQDEITQGQNAERYKAQRELMTAEQQKTDAAAAEVAKMAEDPRRFYGSLSTGGKVQAGIAVALGALGASLTGGPNQALGIIQKAIDDDIAAQRTNMAKAGRDLDRRYDNLRQMRANLNDDVQFDNVMRAQHWDNVARQMDGIDLANAPDTVKANAAARRAEVQSKLDESRLAIAERASANVQQGLAARASVISNAEQLGIARQNSAAHLLAAAAKNNGQIPGLVGRPVSEQAVNEAAKVKAAMDGMRANLTQIQKLYGEHGSESFGKHADTYKALLTDLRLQYKDLKSLGAISGTDAEMMESVIQDPNTFFADKSAQRISSINDAINNAGKARLRSLGYQEQGDAAAQRILSIPGARPGV